MGNDTSDKLATEGTWLHGEDKINLANWLAARHRAYCEFMDMIQVFIINMMTADKEARDLKAKQCNPFALTCMPLIAIPIKLRYSIDVGARRIVLRQLPTCTHKYSQCISELTYMHRFVAFLIVRPLMSQEPGVTWLELLVAFEAHGGS